jgi:hypothetical protein
MLNIENIKGSSLVMVRHMTDQMSIDSGRNIGQYKNIKQNMQLLVKVLFVVECTITTWWSCENCHLALTATNNGPL